MEVILGVSNRHIHINQEDYNLLFGTTEMKKIRNLVQTYQYVSNLFVNIKTDKSQINNVRVLGPIRSYTQVEISKTDAYHLGINPPVRDSGNLKGAEEVIIEGPNGTIKRKAAIIANRHIHLSKKDVIEKHLEGIDEVSVTFNSEKTTRFDNVKLKIQDEGVWELHLDTDDANGALLKTGDIGIITITK